MRRWISCPSWEGCCRCIYAEKNLFDFRPGHGCHVRPRRRSRSAGHPADRVAMRASSRIPDRRPAGYSLGLPDKRPDIWGVAERPAVRLSRGAARAGDRRHNIHGRRSAEERPHQELRHRRALRGHCERAHSRLLPIHMRGDVRPRPRHNRRQHKPVRDLAEPDGVDAHPGPGSLQRVCTRPTLSTAIILL